MFDDVILPLEFRRALALALAVVLVLVHGPLEDLVFGFGVGFLEFTPLAFCFFVLLLADLVAGWAISDGSYLVLPCWAGWWNEVSGAYVCLWSKRARRILTGQCIGIMQGGYGVNSYIPIPFIGLFKPATDNHTVRAPLLGTYQTPYPNPVLISRPPHSSLHAWPNYN
ncbi:hypothetical protein MGYG_02347 [Nannizzia gypsea CBS 118893]|uniref:Uncharacterized protein n=1 Tax=Arthroderma gypseum (strain ATCC MYA-4604 / CBS 118893) TaxID=535722 RepID=E4UR59_ARTGP|nr:hypothetical protein MGYG_02347 [Nannizzia gypsea CBS 118893]EFQ99334.1 hypothetical protein MGYG_02347 [Nannizzia gypsea CBS 118893]